MGVLLRRDGTGELTVGPEVWRLTWNGVSRTLIVVDILAEDALVGYGRLGRDLPIDGDSTLWEGEWRLGQVSWWASGVSDADGLRLACERFRVPLHLRDAAPAWVLPMLAPVTTDVAE
ncbi:MAG: hypothetical protein ACREDC_05710 [Bradyrhizobium sp.]